MLGKCRLILDGGMGTVLMSRGLSAGESSESWSLSHPEVIEQIHLEYLRAGSDIISANTFGVNSLKYGNYAEYIRAAVECAMRARERYYAEGGKGEKFIALDIGPTGKMLKPLGELEFERCVEVFADTVREGVSSGCDLIFIETMTDSYETKAAVLAAKENSSLPVFVSNVYDGSGKLMTGATPEVMVAMLEGLGADAIGANCSLGPDRLLPTLERLISAASVPIIFKPNAGLPSISGGFDIDAEKFSSLMKHAAELGASLIGGCCGTTPEYIKRTYEKTRDVPYKEPKRKLLSVVTSYSRAVTLGKCPTVIGERINPTGKPKLREAIKAGELSYILSEAIAEENSGADILDVNVGVPGIDEAVMMKRAVAELQAITLLPLQIDTGDVSALEAAMRIYNGKPLVNSVSGKRESMDSVLPLVKKYGGTVVALTMDEDGIPATVEGRIAIAMKILSAAREYGISDRDIIFDPLCMAVSSDKNAAKVTLECVSELHKRGYLTSLGVSNVSFGLPSREKLNSTFLAMALSVGLDAAIINPHSAAMNDVVRAFTALSGKDVGFADYISYAEANPQTGASVASRGAESKGTAESLSAAIISGLSEAAEGLCDRLLEEREPLDIINGEIIPALDEVGKSFESGKTYLPSLLMSAEAASSAFSIIKKKLPAKESDGEPIVLATVKGDVHDIGKNIVKLLLESHGARVIDLGRDVAPEEVVRAARESGAKLVGLSALMTTTVPMMERTVALIHESLPEVKVMVGGAVLTEDYAKEIGADYYAKDAMGAVKINSSLKFKM